MKKYLTLTWEALIQVYSQKSYFILTFSFALIVFVTNGLIINYHLLWSNFSLKLVFYLIVGWIMLLPLPALIFIILICLLGGVVFSGSIYLLRKQLHEKKLSLFYLANKITTKVCIIKK